MKKIAILILALHAPAALATYKCVDERGITHIGDTPPAACANVVLYEVSRSGKVLATIQPSLTPEQVAVKQKEAERKASADKAAADQKRKDAALLSSFGSEREFDVARDRNVEPIKGRIATARDRLKQIDKREKSVNEEMEFYKAGKGKSGKSKEMPPNLVADMKSVETERASIQKAIVGYEKEIEEIRAKFDVDKKRWAVIKDTPPAGQPAAALSTPEKAAPKKN